MKLSRAIILLFAIFCNFIASAQVVGGYEKLTPAQINSADVQANLNFGANYVIAQAIKADRIPAGNYEVSKVISVSEQVVAGLNYKYYVVITGESCPHQSLEVEFVVYENLNDVSEVTSYELL